MSLEISGSPAAPLHDWLVLGQKRCSKDKPFKSKSSQISLMLQIGFFSFFLSFLWRESHSFLFLFHFASIETKTNYREKWAVTELGATSSLKSSWPSGLKFHRIRRKDYQDQRNIRKSFNFESFNSGSFADRRSIITSNEPGDCEMQVWKGYRKFLTARHFDSDPGVAPSKC